jgi:hypothetical protein
MSALPGAPRSITEEMIREPGGVRLEQPAERAGGIERQTAGRRFEEHERRAELDAEATGLRPAYRKDRQHGAAGLLGQHKGAESDAQPRREDRDFDACPPAAVGQEEADARAGQPGLQPTKGARTVPDVTEERLVDPRAGGPGANDVDASGCEHGAHEDGKSEVRRDQNRAPAALERRLEVVQAVDLDRGESRARLGQGPCLPDEIDDLAGQEEGEAAGGELATLFGGRWFPAERGDLIEELPHTAGKRNPGNIEGDPRVHGSEPVDGPEDPAR